ncbi:MULTISPECIES: TIGR03759 family integrating conjugative element protein [Steroidobacteraceae]|nr:MULTISPECIES: TIGR03759 family integrating conjugative element protein [Steroidobacteraceae]
MRLLSRAALLTVLLPLSSLAAQSHRAVESRVVESDLRSSTSAALDERLARDWGLKAEEWGRYRQLMQGPLGLYSPNLDPLTALGMEARNEDERQRYAELQVQAERRRVEKLLAYQRAYDEAWQRLYPRQQRITASSLRSHLASSQPLASPVELRLAVFVSNHCPPCDQRVKQLQAAGQPFDLYMVGSDNNDAEIRQWAARAGIEPSKVRAGQITLNHDAGRWAWIGGRGGLPAVVKEIDGRWQRQ